MPFHKLERGTALITVLLIFAIASYLVGEMFDQLNQDLRRTTNVIAQDQAYLYARSAEQLAIELLKQDLKDDFEKEPKLAQDDLSEPWHQSVWFPLEGGGIKAELTDMQSLFNINQLLTQPGPASQRLIALLTALDLLDVNERPLWVNAVKEWLDADQQPQTQGPEDDYYLGLEQPYRTANRGMVSVSELNLVKGTTRELYEKIRPWVTALPTDVPININTIKPELLRLISGISDVDKILSGREKQGYETVELALQGQVSQGAAGVVDPSGAGAPASRLNPKDFSVNSQYFLLTVVANIQERQVNLQSVIYRPVAPSKFEPIRVISRSRARTYHAALPVQE